MIKDIKGKEIKYGDKVKACYSDKWRESVVSNPKDDPEGPLHLMDTCTGQVNEYSVRLYKIERLEQ